MKRLVIIAVAGLAIGSAIVAAQTPGQPRRNLEIFTVEGQPVDKRKPELDTDHPVFPGQTRAPYHKTTDVAVTTLASGLDNAWGLQLLPSTRYLISEKPGRFRILNSDGSTELATTKVGFISPHVDDQTQSLLVKGTVQNPGSRLRAQQYVRARIIWKTTEGLVLPVTSVLRINGRFFAFVAEDSGGKLVAKQRPITVGAIVGDNYAVLDGIKPGERVVTAGAQKLADGLPIQEAPAAGPSNP